MTSEEKNEKNRVIHRLSKAMRTRQRISDSMKRCSSPGNGEELIHRWQVITRRIARIEATLRGYD
jgi:hypothetical protein